MASFESLSSKYTSNDVLRRLYQATTFLSVMMVVWILWIPGSWLLGRMEIHDKLLEKAMDGMKDGIVPPEIVSKYRGHTAVHLTHLLPAALWSAIIPFQLHRGFRKNNPILHRRMGYFFFASSFLMSIGVMIILHRDLYFEKFFVDLPPLPYSSEPLMFITTACFLGSGIYSLKLARDKRFFDHQLWVLRHISFGLWVAVQRFLLGTVAGPLFPKPVSREVQRLSFIVCGLAGMIICHICSEYSIHLMKKERSVRTNLKVN